MPTSDTSSVFNASPTINTSHISHTSHTSLTSHSSPSLTFHTAHTSRTSRTSCTPPITRTSTHPITRKTRTIPAFAVASAACLTNNELRALANNSEDAQLFCPLFLGNQSPILLPTYLSQFSRPQIKSACSCFDAGYDAQGSAALAVNTEVDVVSTFTALPSSAIVRVSTSSTSSSKTSTSAAKGSVIRENRSSSASIISPCHFNVILLSVLVIFAAMTLRNR